MSPEKEGVSGKVIAITGASSGIGEATARRLTREGARVVMGARRTGRLEEIAADIRQQGGTVAFTALDVTDRESVKNFVDYACEQFGRLDVLVSNAGIMPLSLMEEGKVDEWSRMIDVNIKGVLHGIGAALPVFQRQEAGHFVNVTSGADRIVGPTAAVYSGTKFAVRAISEGLRMEVGARYRVSVIAPGATDTELTESISNAGLKSAIEDSTFKSAFPPDTIARAISYVIGEPENTTIRHLLIAPSDS